MSFTILGNKLKLYVEKTEVLCVPSLHVQEVGRRPSPDAIGLILKDQVHSLEVLLDSVLSLEAQVARNAFSPILVGSPATVPIGER